MYSCLISLCLCLLVISLTLASLLPADTNTPATLHSMRWPSGNTKWHTGRFSSLLTFRDKLWDLLVVLCINVSERHIGLSHGKCYVIFAQWGLDFQLSFITGATTTLVFVCVSTFPRALSVQSEPGLWVAWEKSLLNMSLKAPSIRAQSRTVRTNGRRQKKKKKHFSFQRRLRRRRFRSCWFCGIEADRLLRAQWGTYNLLGEWGMKGTAEQWHCPCCTLRPGCQRCLQIVSSNLPYAEVEAGSGKKWGMC